MGEFASKGVAGSGLGLGIAGLSVALLNGANNGGGLLGGILGGGYNRQAAEMGNAAVANKVMEQAAEISQLKAEKYSDQSGIEIYKALKSDINSVADKAFSNLTEVRQNILGEWIKPIAQESAANRERLATLEARVDGNHQICQKDLELMRKDIEISNLASQNGMQKLDNKIDIVAMSAKNGIDINSAAIQCLQNTVAGITKTVVPKTAVCPEPMNRYNSWTAPTTPTTTE